MNFGRARARLADASAKHARELVDVEALVILTDFDEPHAVAAEDRDRGEVRRPVVTTIVAFVEE